MWWQVWGCISTGNRRVFGCARFSTVHMVRCKPSTPSTFGCALRARGSVAGLQFDTALHHCTAHGPWTLYFTTHLTWKEEQAVYLAQHRRQQSDQGVDRVENPPDTEPDRQGRGGGGGGEAGIQWVLRLPRRAIWRHRRSLTKSPPLSLSLSLEFAGTNVAGTKHLVGVLWRTKSVSHCCMDHFVEPGVTRPFYAQQPLSERVVLDVFLYIIETICYTQRGRSTQY